MVRAITLLWILSSCAWTQSGPIREMSARAIIARLMPGFYNGYLYSCEPRHIITLYAPNGQIVLTLPIQGWGNGRVGVQSVAIDSDGALAIGWSDLPNVGIDIRDSFGNLVRSLDTGRYVPAHLSFGEDHSLWAFGWQRDATDLRRRDKQDYLTIKKYSIDGKEIGAYLQRSLFPPGLEPGGDDWQARRITVTSDRVGLEAVSGSVGDQHEWVELDLNGNLTGRWRLDPAYQFPGVVLTADNHAYVHRWDTATKSRQVLRLNRSKAEWEPVNSANAVLYGADGDKLVFAIWLDGVMHMSWYPQP
jgi:hypothetical protein